MDFLDVEGIEYVRGEFFDDKFKAKITITHNSMALNAPAVKLFPDCQHFSVYLDEQNVRLIVMPTTENDVNGLKLAHIRNGKIVPRTCTLRYFSPRLFRFMEWHQNAKYRMLARLREFGDKKVMMFDLVDSYQVISSVWECEEGKKHRTTRFILPAAWKGRFGYTWNELAEKERIGFNVPMITINHKTGEVIRLENL